MTCPFCDESIPAAAKFCPKCSLPLHDDATLTGLPFGGKVVTNRTLLIAGAAAVLAVALIVGLVSAGRARDRRSGTRIVRREPVGSYAAPSTSPAGLYQPAPQTFSPQPAVQPWRSTTWPATGSRFQAPGSAQWPP